ncbi:MAG: glycerophosphodiester phosphodiesterase family protein [Micrococcales bacterium]
MYLYPTEAVRILAHRGLAIAADGSALDENTLPAFARALEVGADYIESDIQVSRDGVPVLFHDDDLQRVAGVASPVGRLTLEELQNIRLEHGGRIPTLAEALEAFPNARFNLDFKSVSSITAGCRVIHDHGAQARVLVASFSDARGDAAASRLPGVARSAGMLRTLRAVIAQKLHLGILLGMALTGVNALQVPTHQGRLRLDSPGFIRAVRSHGVEVHFWTINDPTEMRRLVDAGAAGIVTDRADIAVATLRG